MLWNIERRTNPRFIWGIIAGMLIGIYATRWMIRSFYKGHHNQSEHKKENQDDRDNFNQANDINHNEKKDLFDTFINGTEDDLKQEASDMNMTN